MTDQNLRRVQEWFKPSTLVATAGLIVSLFIFFSSATRDNAAIAANAALISEKRLTAVETTINMRVIPTLNRIEAKIDK